MCACARAAARERGAKIYSRSVWCDEIKEKRKEKKRTSVCPSVRQRGLLGVEEKRRSTIVNEIVVGYGAVTGLMTREC